MLESSQAEEVWHLGPEPRRRRSYSGMWMRRILVCGVLFAIMAWFWKGIEAAHEGARASQCIGNFCQIQLALLNYESANGSLPPAFVTDAKGKPLYSWRVLILPYLEQSNLYAAFRPDEAWDGPNNIKLLPQMPLVFMCPSNPDRASHGFTKCVAITGPGTMFPGGVPAKFEDMTDGADRTIMIAEVAHVAVPWTAPVDLDIRWMSMKVNDRTMPSISSNHPGVANISTAKGYRYRLKQTIRPEELRSLLTIDGNEPIDAMKVLTGGGSNR